MRKKIDTCNGCPQCTNCGRNKLVEVLVCDDCGSDEELYYFDSQELCINCIEKQLERVEE